uniref:Uncharacterized protein n=1 Tax=Desulfobacca acetoxidans TaxID=60893 RepID=A0A7V6A1N1_9BACT
MARRQAKVGATEKVVGYSILATLGVIALGLLIRQAHFNPAVTVALHGAKVQGRLQGAPGQTPAVTAALIPEVSGFTPLTPAQSFGPDNLSDKIDGKAELYLSSGFKEMSCRSFNLAAAGSAYVEVFVYDMGSAPNAFAVFSGQRRPGSPNIPLTANAYATSNALYFTRGPYYVEIVADRASGALQKSLTMYAEATLAKMPAEGKGGPGKAADLLPKEGLTSDSVRLNASDVFGLERFNNVFTGEYTLKNGTATAFLAERATPGQARADAQRYLEFLTANGYQKIGSPDGTEGIEVLKLDDSYEIVLVQGRLLAGVHDASSLAAARELMEKLRTALKL